jgi:hypothetical protein
MSNGEIVKEVRRYLQKEFYLESNTEERNIRMQHAAAKFVHENYPHIKKCVVSFDYFGDISINVA